jgi:hypothetical protein
MAARGAGHASGSPVKFYDQALAAIFSAASINYYCKILFPIEKIPIRIL